MIKIIKSNKFITMLLFIICLFFIFKPNICAKSCLDAVSVWGTKVFPMLFPFFIITRLILNLSEFKPNFMDKFFAKAYHAPAGSFAVFFLSVLCGYPMGAKLICTMHEQNRISNDDGKKMLSFCSVSGPMFIIGTVGVAVFNSYKMGLIILISNVAACLINGLLYRGKLNTGKNILYTSKTKNTLADIVLDSLSSILMVGCYIIISFVAIDLLKEVNAFYVISNGISLMFNDPNLCKVIESILSGFFEITKGVIDLSLTNVNLAIKTVLSSGIIAFGGISILLQSVGFLNNLNIPIKTILLQKFTQCVLAVIISIIITLIFM